MQLNSGKVDGYDHNNVRQYKTESFLLSSCGFKSVKYMCVSLDLSMALGCVLVLICRILIDCFKI